MFRVHHPQMIDFENVIGLRESLKTPLQIPHIRNIEFFKSLCINILIIDLNPCQNAKKLPILGDFSCFWAC